MFKVKKSKFNFQYLLDNIRQPFLLYASVFSLLFLVTSCTEWKDVKITKIENARIIKMDKNDLVAEIDVRVNNPNKVGFKIYKSDLDVLLNNSAVGKAKIKHKVKIKANAEETYTLAIAGKVDNLLSGGGLLGLIATAASGSATINIKGTIKAGKFFYKKKFPIDNKQRVPLLK